LEAACEGEDDSCEVGVAGVDGKETDHCRLGSVVDEPAPVVRLSCLS
jgi:hypothetical protein